MGFFAMGGRTDDDSPYRGSERAIASASRMAGKKAKPHPYTPKKKGHSGGDDEDRKANFFFSLLLKISYWHGL